MQPDTAPLKLERYHHVPRMLLVRAQKEADRRHHESVTLDHLVEQLLVSGIVHETMRELGIDPDALLREATARLEELPCEAEELACLDDDMQRVIWDAEARSLREGALHVSLQHLVHALAAAQALPPSVLEAQISVPSSEPPAKSDEAYLLDGRAKLRLHVARIRRRTPGSDDAFARKTLQSIERGLTLIETLPDLAIEWRTADQLSLQRIGYAPRLNITAHRGTIVVRITRSEVEAVHRFVWDATSVRWAEDGKRELFEVLGTLLETDLYPATP